MTKVIVIIGPTATGKTALSVAIAKKIGGEIVSADSRQVYRGLDVGTGKVTTREMRGVIHHLLDVANPKKQFSAAEFVKLGRAAISEIAARGHIPIIVGGTGFYIDALLGRRELSAVPPDPDFRLRVSGYSLKKLQNLLKKADPKRYKTIDTKNPRRLIRAIEIATHAPDSKDKNLIIYDTIQYDTYWIGLTLPHEELKKKIHMRLFARIRGIEKEVKKLHKKGMPWKRMDELGLEYRYMARYVQKKISREMMLSELEKEIEHYAKRQMTWFKRNKDIQWFSPSQKQKIISLSKKFLTTSV